VISLGNLKKTMIKDQRDMNPEDLVNHLAGLDKVYMLLEDPKF